MRTEQYPANQQSYRSECGSSYMPPTMPTCCCKKSMADALKLLCNSTLSSFIDFQKFAFLSPTFLVGSTLTLIEPGCGPKDNLAELNGEFKRFTVGNCDTIDISGTAVYGIPVPHSYDAMKDSLTKILQQIPYVEKADMDTAVTDELYQLLECNGFCEAFWEAIIKFLIHWFTVLPEVKQASLCGLQSVAFELKYSSDFDEFAALLQTQLSNTNNGCGQCEGHCKCEDCCCNEGIKFGLLSANASHTTTLTAGNLILRDVLALGNLGNVLVFGNPEEGRFYFVCADAVQFLG